MGNRLSVQLPEFSVWNLVVMCADVDLWTGLPEELGRPWGCSGFLLLSLLLPVLLMCLNDLFDNSWVI